MLNRLYIFFIALIISCQNVSEYERIVKDEMARGVYTDSVQFGLTIGDTKKTFFTKAWELNADGKVTHGPNNEFIAYEIENMPDGKRVNHLFYGIFNENDIMTGLDMRFYFLGWAPWNEELQSDKVLPVAMDKLMEWYPGNNFISIENENFPNETFVKIDGNRQILIHIIDEKDVRAQLLDLRYKYPNLIK